MISIELKKILTEKGITMTEVSENTGISKNTLSLLGNGTTKGIQFETLDKLLEYLSIGIQDLIGFSSKKEIENLSISLEQVSDWETSKDYDDSVYEPVPKKKEKESPTEYEFRIEQLEKKGTTGNVIGKTVAFTEKAFFKITIALKDFSLSFKCLFRWRVAGIENYDEVKKRYFKSEYATLNSFNKEMTMYTSSYIFEKGLKKGLNKFLLSEYQKKYVIAELERILPTYTPEGILDFFNEFYVSPENQEKFEVFLNVK